tara:strand:- start:217 stop:369 length:153 start_codon:yes stop_codon:yes gene_type:complete
MHKNKTYNIFKICKTLTLDNVKGAKVPIDFSCKKKFNVNTSLFAQGGEVL